MTPHPHPQGEAPSTVPSGAARPLRSPLGAAATLDAIAATPRLNRTAERALVIGECVVMSRFGQPMARTSDAEDAERIASRVSGYVVYPKVGQVA